MKPYRRLSRIEREVQRLRAWADEYDPERVVGAALLLLFVLLMFINKLP